MGPTVDVFMILVQLYGNIEERNASLMQLADAEIGRPDNQFF